MNAPQRQQPENENPLMNLLFNVAAPAIVLSKFSREAYLGPVYGLIVALAFPLVYGAKDFFDRKKLNVISIIGFVGVLLTAGFGLLKLDAEWIAVKEAAVPLLIGTVIVGSLKTKYPLVRKLLYNDRIINITAVENALSLRQSATAFEKLLVQSSYLLASSFLLSSILNYTLAKVLLVSEPGSAAFNEELGKMTALSYPVIALPSMVVFSLSLWFLLHGIKKLTGLQLEEIFHSNHQKSNKS